LGLAAQTGTNTLRLLKLISYREGYACWK